jgi:hypothetical protein
MWESENQDESPLMTTDNFHGIDRLASRRHRALNAARIVAAVRARAAHLLLDTVTSHQAAACDMGAIETWVASVCQRSDCVTKSTTKNSAEGCDESNCTKLHPDVRSRLDGLPMANDGRSSL